MRAMKKHPSLFLSMTPEVPSAGDTPIHVSVTDGVISYLDEQSEEKVLDVRCLNDLRHREIVLWNAVHFAVETGWLPERYFDVRIASHQLEERKPSDFLFHGTLAELSVQHRRVTDEMEKPLPYSYERIMRLEHALVPVLVAMQDRGVRVNVEAAEELEKDFARRLSDVQKRIREQAGFPVNVNATASLARAFPEAREKTLRGNLSIGKDFLKRHGSSLAKDVLEARRLQKLSSTFVQGYVLNHQKKGRVHAVFDALGAESGRFSSYDPNLQNLPSPDRDPVLASLVRGLFLPEPGHVWNCLDYSQIEYRGLIHYAQGPGADEARALYRDNPLTDYHNLVVEWTGLPRPDAKNANFCLVFRGEIPRLCQVGRFSQEKGEQVYTLYHEKLPYTKFTAKAMEKAAQQRGWVRTFGGRIRHYDLWEPRVYSGTRYVPLPLEQAERAWPDQPLKRGFTFKAINDIIQGSAADLVKEAMVEMHKSGLFQEIGSPLLTVHDELGFSAEEGHPGVQKAKEIMENCVRWNVPIIAQLSTGASWAEC